MIQSSENSKIKVEINIMDIVEFKDLTSSLYDWAVEVDKKDVQSPSEISLVNSILNLSFSKPEKDTLYTHPDVIRVEVIDDCGRSYTNHLSSVENVRVSLQDSGKTLKIFID